MNQLSSITSHLTHHLDPYLADLRTLVSIDSGTDHKAGVDHVVDWLAARFMQMGFAIDRLPQAKLGDNLLARWRGGGTKRILLLGHSDTVFPVGTAAARPMTMTGNIIIGPGTCDMKAGLLTGIYAVESLLATGFADFGEIVFLIVSDEEVGERASVPLIRQTARQVDVGLTLESARANGDIVTARKSSRWCSIETYGKAAHAGVEPEKGRNAILALARLLDQLDHLNGLREGLTLNVGKIEGGRQANVVADYAKASIDLRAWRATDMSVLVEAIQTLAKEPTTPDVRIVCSLDESLGMPAMERTPAVAALEQMTQTIATQLGFSVRGAATGGASDASYIAAEGVPVLDGLGPIGGLDHGPEEYIEVDSIVPRTALLAGLLEAICAE